MFLIKSDFINLCKSMGKDPEFEKLRAEVLSILKKQAKTEGNKKDIHKSLLEMDKSFKYFDAKEFIVKSGYPVGTIREWKGRKYIKVAPNKWKPKYDSESKGAKNSITRLMKQVENCKNVEELMNLVMENKQRFTDTNGNHLPIVDKLRAAADKKNDSLSSGKNSNVRSKKDIHDVTVDDYSFQKVGGKWLVRDENGGLFLGEKFKSKKDAIEWARRNILKREFYQDRYEAKQAEKMKEESDGVKKESPKAEESEAEKHKNRSDSFDKIDPATGMTWWERADKARTLASKRLKLDKKTEEIFLQCEHLSDEANKTNDYSGEYKQKQKDLLERNQLKIADYKKYRRVVEKYFLGLGNIKNDEGLRGFSLTKEEQQESKKKDEVAEPKKKSSKNSKSVSSAYAPSESADLDSKEIIASNKSIGDGEVEMPYSKELDAEIKSLNNFRSSDETRKFLTSVYYDNGNLVSTDARRLKTIKVGKLEGIPNGSYVDVTSGKDGVKIKVKEVENSDGSKAKFPDYTNVIPAENNQKVTLDNTTLKDKLKTMLKDGSIDKKVGRVALEFKDDGVFLDGTKVGNASGINLKYERWRESDIATNSININANYLLDALAGDESIMMLSDNQNKAISIATGSTNNIIMPMQPVDESDPNKLPDYEAGRKAKAEADKYKADLRNALIEGNKKQYEEATKDIENVSSDKIISNITDLKDDKLASIWDLGNMPVDKLHAVKDWSKNKKLTKVSYNYATILKHHYIMQRPEVRDAIEAEMKKRGLDTSIRKSLFDDIDFGDDVEKSIYPDGPELFESVNIAETVRSVLSEII